jgi:predicted RNase H-like HicB family nuclease
MSKHEIIPYWGDEDQVFIAEVPELPGCIAHGETQESALTNVKEAIELWIDTAREFGDPVAEPKGRRLMVSLEGVVRKMTNDSELPQMDKTAFSVASLFDEPDDKAYWLSKTPHERLQALELMRQIIYGYDPSSERLQRVLEVAEFKPG